MTLRSVIAATCGALLLGAACAVQAGTARDRLDEFLGGLDALQADFRQVLLDEQGRASEESRGVVYLHRPGRFRWDYRQPHPQIVVADGQRLWLYDPELEQVTVQPQAEALGATPAALLASERPLEESFRVTELPPREDGTAWLALAPRDPGSSFEGIRVGLGAQGLEAMELEDGFGQTTRIEFSDIRRNPDLDADLFRFTPPEGVDVIRGQ